MKIEIKPIGVIHSPCKSIEDVPMQAYCSEEVGEIEIFKNYEKGLRDIDRFSHIQIFYIFHRAKGYSLLVKPFLDEYERGLFATRHPNRPNPIGISTVRLLEKDGNILKIKCCDVMDGTPLIDLKPYVPKFDERKDARFGWLEDILKD